MHSFPPASPAFGAPGCQNCGGPRYGAYCHVCGQHYLEGRLTVGGILKEFVTKALSLENGLLHTFVQLSLRPGRTISEYIRGRRRRYTHPVAYLLLSAAVSAAVWPLRARSFNADLARNAAADDALVQRATVQVVTAFQLHPVFSALLICSFFVPLQRLLFRGRITFAESFVYALFVFGHAMMLESLLTPLAVLVTADASHILDLISFGILLYLVGAAAAGYFGWRVSTFVTTALVMAGAFLGLLCTLIFIIFTWYVALSVAQGATRQ